MTYTYARKKDAVNASDRFGAAALIVFYVGFGIIAFLLKADIAKTPAIVVATVSTVCSILSLVFMQKRDASYAALSFGFVLIPCIIFFSLI